MLTNSVKKIVYGSIFLIAILLFAKLIIENVGQRSLDSQENEVDDSSISISSESDVSNVSASNKSDESKNDTSSHYRDMYPDLYVTPPSSTSTKGKTVYLTFDDGPSNVTNQILDTLSEKGVKATFFVIGTDNEKIKNIMRRIVNEGHSIGIHTYCHDYEKIYASVESYLEDFNRIYELIYDTTNVKPNIFRFPGGSKNSFNKDTYQDIKEEMTRRGFVFYDWNISNGDCEKNYSVENCIKNVFKYSKGTNRIISLMHDAPAKKYTAQALPQIIDGLKKQGFSFDRITNDVTPIVF